MAVTATPSVSTVSIAAYRITVGTGTGTHTSFHRGHPSGIGSHPLWSRGGFLRPLVRPDRERNHLGCR